MERCARSREVCTNDVARGATNEVCQLTSAGVGSSHGRPSPGGKSPYLSSRRRARAGCLDEVASSGRSLVSRRARTGRPKRRGSQGHADRLPMAIGRACRDAGVPHISPHDLLPRRISLLYGMPGSWPRSASSSGSAPGSRDGRRNTRVLSTRQKLRLLEEALVYDISLGFRRDHNGPVGSSAVRAARECPCVPHT
jgi:hypothetical protein